MGRQPDIVDREACVIFEPIKLALVKDIYGVTDMVVKLKPQIVTEILYKEFTPSSAYNIFFLHNM